MSEESPPLPPRLRLYRFALQLVLQPRLMGHPAKPSPTIESGCGGLPPALSQAPVMRAGEVCHMLPQATIRVPRIRRFQARLEARGCPS
jgi:hypothetical protein